MDELLMDWLYEELDPARSARVAEHAGGCARCSAELAALRRTREAFREMSDLEPPPALSAILLHEAARRAPSAEAGAVVVAVSADGDTGLWARIAAWLRPLALHPAATAACTIVLLAGVAGALYVRSGGDMAASTYVSSPDLAPPPPADPTSAATGESGGAALGNAPEADEEETPAEKPVLQPRAGAQDLSRDADGANDALADRQPSGFAAGVLDSERQEEVRQAEGEATKAPARAADEKLAEKDNKESAGLRYKRKTLEASRGQKGDVGEELDQMPRRAADKQRTELEKKVSPSRRDYAAPPATTARAEEPASDPAPAPGGGEVGRTRGPSPSAPPKAEPPEPSPAASDDRAVEPNGSTAGASATTPAPVNRSRAQLAWLSSQEGKISSLTRRGKCREVAAVANDILDRDPSYYVSRVQGGVLAGKCQRLVGDEQRRRASRRASKNVGGSQRNVKAAAESEQAAPADADSEKAQKK